MNADEQLPDLLQGAVDVVRREELIERLGRGVPLRVKLGIDPTSPDIHLGFAVVLRKLRQFQDHGHVAVLILGDYTAQVGDPSGRNATRPRLDKAEVDAHAETYVAQITEILDPSPQRLEIRRNSEWLAPMRMDEVLRLTALSTVAQMLERNDFAKRYDDGAPISISEFMYPLLQGWDSVMVECDVELGGTDQLFNLIMGRNLQGQSGQTPQVVLTTPLLEGLGGGPKMSKSLGNYVGIAEAPNDQFGKLMSIPDHLLPQYFQYTTGWKQAEIDTAQTALDAGDLHPNQAKRLMARTVCDLYHGPGAGESAEAEFDRVHKSRERPSNIPLVEIGAGDLPAKLSTLLRATGLVSSAREAGRKIVEGAVRINDEVVREDLELSADGLDGAVLQVGRRAWAEARIVRG